MTNPLSRFAMPALVIVVVLALLAPLDLSGFGFRGPDSAATASI